MSGEHFLKKRLDPLKKQNKTKKRKKEKKDSRLKGMKEQTYIKKALKK